MNTKILIIEDDELLAATFQRFLRRAGYMVDVAGDYAGGKELLTLGSYSAVFMDINLNGRRTGIDLLKYIRETNMDTPVVIVTGCPEVSTAAEAVRNAAFDYLCKPIEKDKLLEIAKAAVSHKIKNDEKETFRKNMEATLRSVRDSLATVDLNELSSVIYGATDDFQPGVGRAMQQLSQSSAHIVPSLPNAVLTPLLSMREQEILAMVGQGESNADIAASFSISIRTVETYFARIIDKLGLVGMKNLRRYAIRNQK